MFAKAVPHWVKWGIFASAMVSVLAIGFLSVFSPSLIGKSLLAFGFFWFGLSIFALACLGTKQGFLPGRFYVSKEHNALQFWLTIFGLGGLALLMIYVGIGGFLVLLCT